MKANLSRVLAFAIPVAALGLASCSDPRVEPTPAPSPRPAPAPRPAPMPDVDWREAAITPGDWTWGMVGGASTATFAGGLLQFRCDRANATVTLSRAGSGPAQVPVTISTSATTRTLTASGAGDRISLNFTTRDPLLDAMAFSRGRFAFEAAGMQPVYAPSWPEISRVIEDCR